MKKESFTEQCRDNPFILATIFFGLIVVILVVTPILKVEENYLGNDIENNTSVEQQICSQIRATPSWLHFNGTSLNLVNEGYIDFHAQRNMSWDVVNEYLIPNKVVYVYRDSCSWCNKQKELFGETWEDYLQSGLTVDCD